MGNSRGEVVSSREVPVGSTAARAILETVSWSTTFSMRNLADGQYTLRVEEVDGSGNSAVVSIPFALDTVNMFVNIDRPVPEVTQAYVKNTRFSGRATSNSRVTLTITDISDRTITRRVQVSGVGVWEAMTDLSTLQDGPLIITAVADDQNGHTANAAPRAVTLDREPNRLEVPVPVATPVYTPVPTPVRIYVVGDDEDSSSALSVSLVITFVIVFMTLFF